MKKIYIVLAAFLFSALTCLPISAASAESESYSTAKDEEELEAFDDSEPEETEDENQGADFVEQFDAEEDTDDTTSAAETSVAETSAAETTAAKPVDNTDENDTVRNYIVLSCAVGAAIILGIVVPLSVSKNKKKK